MTTHSARAIVTDIEGTTTDIAFVHKVLFPYARKALPAFVRAQASSPQVAADLAATAQLADKPEAELDQLIAILIDWIDQDRKATPLKSLQGQIWKAGYENGDFRGHIYPDAHAGLTRWHAQGAHMSVYSSGSIAAQQLLFGHSDFGDMRPLFQAWFDTTTGPKRDTQSYSKIAQALDFRPDHILFLSDVSAELDAAREAGLQTIHLVRDDSIMPTDHEAVTSFDAIHLEIAQ